MKEEKTACEPGFTHFITPSRKCAGPTIWDEDEKSLPKKKQPSKEELPEVTFGIKEANLEW